MLATLVTDPETLYDSAAAALTQLERRHVQRLTLSTSDLRVGLEGTLSYVGHSDTTPLHNAKLTDIALAQIEGIVKLPSHFAAGLDQDLHKSTVNELLRRRYGDVTVITEANMQNPDDRVVVAVVPGGRTGIDDALVLRVLADKQVPARITIRPGTMDVRFGSASAVEVLPSDVFELHGQLHNRRWGADRAANKSAIEFSVLLYRLVCANGAYVRREISSGRLTTWATHREVEAFMDHQLKRVLAYPERQLQSAATRMSNEMPEEAEALRIRALLTRAVGADKTNDLLANAVSFYDHANAITGAAHHAPSETRRRALQVEGGALIQRFFDRN